jgi:hypothetical protein
MMTKDAPQSCKRLSRVEWQEVQAAYQRGEGSCAELAERFEVTPVSVQNRCKRGGWRKELVALDRVVGQIVTEDLAERGFGLAKRRQRFLERTMDESESWLDQIVEAKKLLGSEDIDGLRKLVSAWQVPVEVGRKAYGLNAEEKTANAQTLVSISMAPASVGEAGTAIRCQPIDV